MSVLISSIYFSPVKSLSLSNIESCEIKKNLGILNDRNFVFSRAISLKEAQLIEKKPNERKLNNFLTLKNSPVLNKYNFEYKDNKLALICDGRELISIIANDPKQKFILVNKLVELEKSITKPTPSQLKKIRRIHLGETATSFPDDFMIKDGGTIGVASTNDAITISSAGIVTFKDDILIKDGGTIGVASTVCFVFSSS